MVTDDDRKYGRLDRAVKGMTYCSYSNRHNTLDVCVKVLFLFTVVLKVYIYLTKLIVFTGGPVWQHCYRNSWIWISVISRECFLSADTGQRPNSK